MLADYDTGFAAMSLDEATVDLSRYIAAAFPPCTHSHSRTCSGGDVCHSTLSGEALQPRMAAAQGQTSHGVILAPSDVALDCVSDEARSLTVCRSANGKTEERVSLATRNPQVRSPMESQLHLLDLFLAMSHGASVQAISTDYDTDASTNTTAQPALSHQTSAPAEVHELPPIDETALRRMTAERVQLKDVVFPNTPLGNSSGKKYSRNTEELGDVLSAAESLLHSRDMWTCVRSGEAAMRVPSDAMCDAAIRARFQACNEYVSHMTTSFHYQYSLIAPHV